MLVTLYSLLRNKFKEDENSFHMKRSLHELIFNKHLQQHLEFM